MKNIKFDVEKAKSIVVSTIADNREVIGAVLGTILTSKLCKAFDIPVSNIYSLKNSFGVKSLASAGPITLTISAPVNSTQTAIYSVYKNALSLDSDYYKSSEVKRIYNIVKSAPVGSIDDSTKSYAIDAMTGIQSNMTSSYYKSDVSRYIDALLKI